MVSFKSTVLSIALAFATSVVAQSQSYTIDPESVDIGTRTRWCSDQIIQCPMVCKQTSGGTPEVNTCDPESLSYGCLCSNGVQPNITEYSLTLPYYICTEWGNQCVKDCGNHNNECASACREEHPCGALNPTRANATTTSADATATATSTSSSGPSLLSDSGSSSSSGGSSSAAASLRSVEAGRMYGLAALMGGLLAGFAML
ncbi:hypothetical protein HOO65_010639 [Ceratocystis lukuohia]|uniref:DUF7707 domain-containing protein n=2 Tax=Ceratocystis TaxID=5157 RepID=A0A0F8B1F3_CERFI|nr:hypothetical protein CFO_g2597 [Ceratocystis platani]